MPNISITANNIKKYNKRLQKVLETQFKTEVALYEASKILAKTLGFGSEYELSKLLSNPAAQSSPYTQMLLCAQNIGANLIRIKKTALQVTIDYYNISSPEEPHAFNTKSESMKELSLSDYNNILTYLKNSAPTHLQDSSSWASSKLEKLIGFDLQINASYLKGDNCEYLFVNVKSLIFQPERVFLQDLSNQDSTAWESLLDFKSGGVIICGSTYSGKTTLANALKNTFRNKQISVVEIEDEKSAKEFLSLSQEQICIGTLLTPCIEFALERFRAYGVFPEEAKKVTKHIHIQTLQRQLLN